MGVPQKWMVFVRKIPLKWMIWGYSRFRKPLYLDIFGMSPSGFTPLLNYSPNCSITELFKS